MICIRCNLRNCNRGRDMCDICHLNILDNSPKDMIDDTEILEYYMHKAIWDGCNECGNNNFYCEAGIKEEEEVKWYIIGVRCPNCRVNYEQIMEVRMNESKEDKQNTRGE